MLTERLKKTNKQTIGLISKKQQLRAAHFFAVVLHHYNVELPNYAFYE